MTRGLEEGFVHRSRESHEIGFEVKLATTQLITQLMTLICHKLASGFAC